MFSTTPQRGTIEVAPHFEMTRRVTHVLFDFDGTLSLLRSGWPEIMVAMFLEMLPPLPGESREQAHAMLFDDMMRLNGKQTIFQMQRFAERLRERSARAEPAEFYREEYARRLRKAIDHRSAALHAGTASPRDFVVAGAFEFLNYLRERGYVLYLASGTDEPSVRREAALLGLTEYFGNRFHAARDENFSKKAVIESMLVECKIPGAQLMSFGDGYVELVETKAVGGIAVAVACAEEENGSGKVDAYKRELLLASGADIVLPDYRDGVTLMERVCG